MRNFKIMSNKILNITINYPESKSWLGAMADRDSFYLYQEKER